MPFVLVGLGNPGAQYALTRHNAGFLFLDYFAQTLNTPLWQEKFQGQVTAVKHETYGNLVLLKPQTFMNLSGQSVGACLRFFKLSPKHLFVIHDDLDSPLGTWKLKKGGNHGGHNGLRHIHKTLATDDYVRLKIGISRPADKSQVINYVISPFSQAEQKILLETFEQIVPQEMPAFLAALQANT
ncbi:peptidyl-tRNA hydrolase [Alphaproteobacteria bacterium]|nr:peptidyl-tRNA hydrolase [Alphaproteobacteria bacterium]